jgi:hypothetical protein
MNSKNWVFLEGGWHHRPLWKVAINSVLRLIQKGSRHQWLVVTRVAIADRSAQPDAIGYGFCKVEMRDAP